MTTFEDFHKALTSDTGWMTTMAYVHKGKDLDQGIKEALLHLIADEDRMKRATLSDCKKLVNSWMSTKRFPRENIVKKGKRDLTNL